MNSIKCGGGYIHKISMSDIEYIGYFYGKNGNESIQSAYARVTKERGKSPDLFFNAELFETSTRKAASDVVCGGKIHRLTEGYGIAFPNNKTAVFSYKNNVNAKDYVGAYPVLIQGGVSRTIVPDGLGGRRGRTAIGVDGENLYVALVPDGSNDLTLAELRIAFREIGAENAINLDGGVSTQFYSPRGNHFTGRNVRGFIGVWFKSDKKKDEETKSMKKYASEVVKQAQAWLGCKESDGTHKGIIDIYNSHKPLARGYKVKYTDAWCATFVSAVAIKLGYTDIIPTECSCSKMIEKFKELGAWVEDESVIPEIGWIPFYDWEDTGKGDNRGAPNHVGIVDKVSNGKITVIEGNYNNSVKRRAIDVNGRYIRGYGVPKYDKEYDLDENSLQSDCKKLADAGIINSPEYWAKGSGYSDANVVSLIQKFAAYLKKGG